MAKESRQNERKPDWDACLPPGVSFATAGRRLNRNDREDATQKRVDNADPRVFRETRFTAVREVGLPYVLEWTWV